MQPIRAIAPAVEIVRTAHARAKNPNHLREPTPKNRATPVTNADLKNKATIPDTEQKKRRLVMPAVVIGLLGGHMLFIFTAITLGTGDPSFAVVPDYYQKGVDYDEHKALLVASAELGWSVELTPTAQPDSLGRRDMVFHFRDEAGMPVRDLRVLVEAYHLARAADVVQIECVEVLPGQYVGQVQFRREGFWHFGIDASHDDQRFVQDLRPYISLEGTVK